MIWLDTSFYIRKLVRVFHDDRILQEREREKEKTGEEITQCDNKRS